MADAYESTQMRWKPGASSKASLHIPQYGGEWYEEYTLQYRTLLRVEPGSEYGEAGFHLHWSEWLDVPIPHERDGDDAETEFRASQPAQAGADRAGG